MLAGCGGGVQKTVRAEAKQFLGDGNPEILRIETIRNTGGTREVVARVHGHFKLSHACMNPRGCPPHRPSAPVTYAWLDFSASDPSALAGMQTTSATQLAAIDNARDANSELGIFPDFTSSAIRCDIPRGSSSGTVAGGCVTLFNRGALSANAHIQIDRVQGAVAAGRNQRRTLASRRKSRRLDRHARPAGARSLDPRVR